MSASTALAGLLVALAATLAGGVASVHAEEATDVGGAVPSTLSLSLSEPSPFVRSGAGGGSVYTATIQAQATATDAPTRLTITDGEAVAGRRHGHMVKGASILSSPLLAAAGGGSFRSLDAGIDPLLERWEEPVSAAVTTIRVRQRTHGSASAFHKYHKLLLVTIAAAGP